MAEEHFPLSASRLGLGSASLGSRVSLRQGKRVIEQAIDNGINWFDTAPAYGDGQAESALGEVLARTPRDSYVICTKVGIAPRQMGLAKRTLKPIARKILSGLPSMRAKLARSNPVRKETITPDLITRSLQSSLRALRTDYVDLLLLHDPTEDLLADADAREAVLTALQSARKSGHVRFIGATGHADRLQPHAADLKSLHHLQCAVSLHGNDLPRAQSSFALYSVGRLAAQIQDGMATSRDLATAIRDHADAASDQDAARRLALDYALLEADGKGPVIMSMLSGNHLDTGLANLQRFESMVRTDDFRQRVYRIVTALREHLETMQGSV
ncbi:MAG: aldo/keto reductase [Pseudomonadota bacterium]